MDVYEIDDPQFFHDAIKRFVDASPSAASVEVKDGDAYKGTCLFRNETGEARAALTDKTGRTALFLRRE